MWGELTPNLDTLATFSQNISPCSILHTGVMQVRNYPIQTIMAWYIQLKDFAPKKSRMYGQCSEGNK